MTDSGLSIAEAAARLHVSTKTVRQRIKSGALHAVKVPGRRGPEWRVYLDGVPDVQVDRPDEQDANSAMVEMVRLVGRLQRDTQDLARQVGFLQAKLESVQKQNQQLRLLMAPNEDE